MAETARLHLGQVLCFDGNPLEDGPGVVRIDAEGALCVDAGRIVDVGPARRLEADWPEAAIIDHGDALITPGFVDAHVHYPQTAIIASWGKRLIDWLETYTFPEEARFSDPAHAAAAAECYVDLALAHGTTSFCSFATIHSASVDAIFEAAARRGMRIVAGKTCMDRNAPADLRDSAQAAFEESEALITRWHGRDRLGVAITPRFAPTSTPEQLSALGALWSVHPECLMQTHLSEQREEIEWVRALYPEARDYLDVYERHGLLGERAVFGHAIHLTERERARLAETRAAVVHCPTSNTFIGSGLFDLDGLSAAGLRVGLATDTGGGSSFAMLRTMAAAYEIAQLRGVALHPATLLWLATCGSATSLHLGDRIGTLASGFEADFVVLDLHSTPAIEQRVARADTIWEAVFPTIMMGDDRAVMASYVAGELAGGRMRQGVP